RPALADVKAEQLPELWKDLADADAVKAYKAALALSAAPAQAVPFLSANLPREAPKTERIDKLIRDLDDDDFDVREKATTELEVLGAAVVPALRRALVKSPSVEVRGRLLKLIDKQKGDVVDLTEVRVTRTLEVLERAGTPEAVTVLEGLA